MHSVTVPPSVPVPDRLLARRVLLLDGDLDDAAAVRAAAVLLLLAAEHPDREVCVLVGTTGGTPSAATTVRDAIAVAPHPVATVGLGSVGAAGRLLLAAGTPGRRFVLPGTRVATEGTSGFGGGSWLDAEAAVGAGIADAVLGSADEALPAGSA